ncbi:MAG: AMIN domain-containing protein [Myxococcales bacterium]|nr:AMIN domain-containing protein [Myxococcales bacterium]
MRTLNSRSTATRRIAWQILALAWGLMLPLASAVADVRNTVGALAVQAGDTPAATKVTIGGSRSATFNVYRLERPNRVVIDVSGATLAASVGGQEQATTLTSSTWAVSQVSAQQLADNGSLVRVVVTMARPGTYDVKAVGNDIHVTVTSRDAPPKGTSDGAEVVKAKAAVAQAQADTAVAKQEAETARGEAQAAKAAAEAAVKQSKAELARAEKALKASKTTGASKLQRDDAAVAVAEAKAQKDRADAALAESKAAMAQAQAKTDEATKYRRDAALAYARAEKQSLEASALRGEVEQAKRDAEVARAEATKAKEQAAKARSDAQLASTQAKSAKGEAEHSKRQAEAATSAAAQAKREAEAAKLAAVKATEEAKIAKAAAITKSYEQGVLTLASAPASGAAAAPRMASVPRPLVSSFGATAAPITQTSVSQTASKRRVYRGQTVNLNVKEAPIHDLLRLLADVGRVNMVVPDDISYKITVKMNKVPWDQALEVILSSKGLWYRREGNLMRIDERKKLDDEDRQEAERIAAAVAQEAPEPQILILNYADASGTKTRLESLLSPKGRIEIDDRTNSLVVTDIRAHRRRIESLARRLDTQTPQISIEARIVEARSSFSREFGIQWGGGRAVNQGLSVLGGAADDAPTLGLNTDVADPNYAVNLPAASNAGIGFTLPKVFGIDLSLRLSAAEENGIARVISAPKVTTINNSAASIAEGVQIPVQVVSASGTRRNSSRPS